MNETRLHIVSFNIPYPANYGGVIDVFYKLKTLSEIGVKIILHTFEYGREHAKELEQYCEEVYYYKRKTGIFSQFSLKPYIVYSRRNKDLLANLLKNNSPILFEGLHTCYYLNHPALKNRLKLVRVHNIESAYYQGLAKNTSRIMLKAYFRWEAFRLKIYEKQLRYANYLLTLSITEHSYFESIYGKDKTVYIPLFFQQDENVTRKSSHPSILFHGDLSNWENINAVRFLIRSVASGRDDFSWVFAGLNPHPSLLKLAEKYPNVSIRGNLTDEQLNRLLNEARINVLFTNQVSGVKLKLLNVLSKGWYCLATREMVNGSGLEDLCEIIEKNPDSILDTIDRCIGVEFPESELEKREVRFQSLYNNEKNAFKIKFLLGI